MRYFLYARKSSDSEERQILSIEAQLSELKEFAAKEKLEIIASFEEAKTAKEPGRMKFAEMLDRMEHGEAEGILAWHPDRLARNSVDGGRIIYLLDIGKIENLKFPTFWFDNTPQGKFMLNLAFGQSKYYVDNLSENVKRGIRQKLREGTFPRGAPTGYVNNLRTKKIDVDPHQAPLIAKVFELYASGEHTLISIQQFLARSGIRSNRGFVLSISSVQSILKNPFYYGQFWFTGELHQGNHEPIIPKKLFDKVQQVMSNRGKKNRRRKHEFVFSGFLKCGSCGCAITAEQQKGHNYYRCTKKKQPCNEKYVREETLVELCRNILRKVSLPRSWADKMLTRLDQEKVEANSAAEPFAQNLLLQKVEIDRKLDKLLDLHIDGSVSSDDYRNKKQKLLDERAELQQQIDDFGQRKNNWLEPMREIILQSRQAKTLEKSDNISEIREFLKTIGSNFILRAKTVAFEPEKGWRAREAGEPFPAWQG